MYLAWVETLSYVRWLVWGGVGARQQAFGEVGCARGCGCVGLVVWVPFHVGVGVGVGVRVWDWTGGRL